MRKYLNLASFYLALGLVGGVFFREFTKLNGFEGQTTLKALHPHALILGFFMFLGVILFEKSFNISKVKHFSKWLIAYNVTLVYVWITMLIRGIAQVRGFEVAGLNHIAGLAHALFGIAMIWFIVILYKAIGKEEK